MTKPIRLNAFEMNCVGHQSPGLWAHPRDRSRDYNRPDYWTELAQDAGARLVRRHFPGRRARHLRRLRRHPRRGAAPCGAGAGQRSAAADAGDGGGDRASRLRRHLQPVLRAALSVRPPHVDARPPDRRPDRLEHRHRLSRQRRARHGPADAAAHDERYDLAEEYMEVVYKLWEGSWEDGAVRARPGRGLFADPAKVHRDPPRRAFFGVDAIHLCEPSPQRTPVLYQAGASTAGREFAARHAECVFINGPSPTGRRRRSVADLRRRAAAHGRDPADLLIFTLGTVITGATEAEARRQARGIPPLCRPRGGAGAVLGLDRGRFLALPARPGDRATSRPRRCARRWRLHPGPTRTGLDRARDRRACRDRRRRPAVRRRAGAGRRRARAPGSRRPASTGSTWPTR